MWILKIIHKIFLVALVIFSKLKFFSKFNFQFFPNIFTCSVLKNSYGSLQCSLTTELIYSTQRADFGYQPDRQGINMSKVFLRKIPFVTLKTWRLGPSRTLNINLT